MDQPAHATLETNLMSRTTEKFGLSFFVLLDIILNGRAFEFKDATSSSISFSYTGKLQGSGGQCATGHTIEAAHTLPSSPRPG